MPSIVYILQIHDIAGDQGLPNARSPHKGSLPRTGESPGVWQHTDPTPNPLVLCDIQLTEEPKTNMDVLKLTAS